MGARGDRNREAREAERAGESGGAVHVDALGPAPISFLDELIRGPWTSPAFPVLDRAFNVTHSAVFKRDVVQEALDSIVVLTGGRVGYVFYDHARAPEIEFIYDPTDPNIDHGRKALAVTYRRTSGNVTLGARIVYGVLDGFDDHGAPSYRPDSVTVARHELGHAIFGFGHLEGFRSMAEGPFVMGGIGERDWHEWERQAVAEKMQPPKAGAKAYQRHGWDVVACGGGHQ